MTELICEFCKKTFSSKGNCQKHLLICKIKKDIEIKRNYTELELLKSENSSLKSENISLKSELEFLKNIVESQNRKQIKNSEKITNSNNNTQINIFNNTQSLKDIIANLEPINFEEMRDSFENDFSNKYIDNGIEGLARFICDIPCQNKIVTTDFSRKLVSYKTSDQQVVVDPNGFLLLNTAIKQNADTIIDKTEGRYQYWKNQVKDSREEGIDPEDSDVDNRNNTKKLMNIATKVKENVHVKSLEASNVIIMKGMENKNSLNALE